MFTLLEKVAAFLLSATKTYQEYQDRKRLRTFGKRLTTCYLRLLEVIATGNEIVKALEFYVRRYEHHLSSGDDWVFDRGAVVRLIAEQSVNLRRLYRALDSVLMELRLLSPEVAAEIKISAVGKRASIGKFGALFGPLWNHVDLLGKGRMPTESSPAEAFTSEPLPYEEFEEKYDAYLISAYKVVNVRSEWDRFVFERLKEYLAADSPRERLKTLEQCAQQLREVILQNFKLEDILWGMDGRFYEIT
jgi:hypothetical protein